MGARIAQLRNAFGLDDSEELYGQFSCAHTRPRWGAQFLQGQLYVFSSVMVFHANLLAVIKVERIQFKDVHVIRKRSFMRMPNTIAVVRCDSCTGATRDDVFTSFLFASRRKAFELMVARWRAANPEAADAYLSSLAAASGPGASLLPRSGSSSLSGEPHLFRRQPSTAGSDSSGAAAGGAGGAVAGPLPFPGWREVSGPAAEQLLAVPGDMAVMADAVLPGVSARTLAEVLLSDQSGFLPFVYQAQGNELVSLTPWQVCSGRQTVASAPHLHPPPGSLTRTLQYVYSTSGPWGAVRSLVVQEQLLLPAPGGRLVLLITQRMPDLPAGAGKCFYMTIRWDISPAAADTAAARSSGAAADAAGSREALASEHPVSPHTPTAAQPAGAAAAAASARAAPADTTQQQVLNSAPAAVRHRSSSTPSAAACDGTTDGSDDEGYSSDSSSLSSLQPLRISSPQDAAPLAGNGSGSSSPRASAASCPAMLRPQQQQQQLAGATTSQTRHSSKQSGSSNIFSTKSAPLHSSNNGSSSLLHASGSNGSFGSSSSSRPLSPSRRSLSSLANPSLHHGFEEVVERVERLPSQIRSGIKHSFSATKKGLRELRRSAAKSTSHALSASPLIGAATLGSLVTRRESMERHHQQQQQARVSASPLAAGAAGAAAAGTPTAQQDQQQPSVDLAPDDAAEPHLQQALSPTAAAVTAPTAEAGRLSFSSPAHEQQQRQAAYMHSSTVEAGCSTPVSPAATAAVSHSAASDPSSQVSFGLLGLASGSSTPSLTPVGLLHQGLTTPAAAASPLGPLSQGLQVLAAHSPMQQQETGRSPTAAAAAAAVAAPVRSLEASFAEAAAAANQPHRAPPQQQQDQPAPANRTGDAAAAGQHLQELCDAAEALDGPAACDITANALLSSRDQAAQDAAVLISSTSSSRPGSFTVGGSGGSGTSSSSDKKGAAGVGPTVQLQHLQEAGPAAAAVAAGHTEHKPVGFSTSLGGIADKAPSPAGTTALAPAAPGPEAAAALSSTPAITNSDGQPGGEAASGSSSSIAAGVGCAAGPGLVRGALSAIPEAASSSRRPSTELLDVPAAAAASSPAAAAAKPSNPAAESSSAPGVQWQVRASVTFTKWHMVQSKIEKDCVATAAASLADIVAQGSAWLRDEAARCSLAEVMPQAAAAVAAAAVQRHQHQAGGRQLHRGQGVHRRSGSAGSSAALRLALSGGKPAGHLARSSSSNSIAVASNAAAGAATAAAGAGSSVVAAVLAVLAAVVRFVQFAVSGLTSVMSAAAGAMNLGQGQQLVALGVLAVVGVQLALLWQVVVLQQRVVELLQLQQQAACSALGGSGV